MWLPALCMVFLVLMHGSDAGDVSTDILNNDNSDKSLLKGKLISPVETEDEDQLKIIEEQQLNIDPNYDENVRLYDSGELAPQVPAEQFGAGSGLEPLSVPRKGMKSNKRRRKKIKNIYRHIIDEPKSNKQNLLENENGLLFRKAKEKERDEETTQDDDAPTSPSAPAIIGEIKRHLRKFHKKLKKLFCKACRQIIDPGSETTGSETGGSEIIGSETTGSESGGFQTFQTSGGFDSGGFKTSGGFETSGGFDSGGFQTSGGFDSGGFQTSGGFETGGTETTGYETGGAETGESEIIESETTGSESGGFETSGSKTTGSETGGAETSGSETTGSETGGSETSGAETTGSGITGSETTGYETTGT